MIGNEKISKLPEQDILEVLDKKTNYLFKKKERKKERKRVRLIWNFSFTAQDET